MKNIIGIVCEYNPFHEGHRYHVEQSRKLCGACDDSVVICCMSGDFVQRGEWAILPKHERAAAAVKGGADLVVELPLPWSLSSAEGFAEGAVSILHSLGITHLSFGSESGDIRALSAAADRISMPEFNSEVSYYMKLHPDMSYPAARNAVLGDDVLNLPNNLLGAEYLKAMRKIGSSAEPVAVLRKNSDHDGCNSAMERREMMRRNGEGANDAVLEIAAVSRLRAVPAGLFSNIRDAENGAGDRLYSAVRAGGLTVDEICRTAKTKSMTYSRLRRIAMRAVLALTDDYYEGMPPYARVLAMNARGMEYLSSLRSMEETSVPVVVRPSEVKRLDVYARKVFDAGAAAKDFHNLGFADKNNTECGEDWRLSPRIYEKM